MQSGQELIRTSGSPPMSRANCFIRPCSRSLFSAASEAGSASETLPPVARKGIRGSTPGSRRREDVGDAHRGAEDARAVELARRDQRMRADADFLARRDVPKRHGEREKRARRMIDAGQVGVDDRVVGLLGAIIGMGRQEMSDSRQAARLRRASSSLSPRWVVSRNRPSPGVEFAGMLGRTGAERLNSAASRSADPLRDLPREGSRT